MKKILFTLLCLSATLLPTLHVYGQQAQYGKLSPWVRSIVAQQTSGMPRSKSKVSTQTNEPDNRLLTAFVQTAETADSLFAANGCHVLMRCGDIYIVSIPINRISALSRHNTVMRIEARRGTHALMDITSKYIGATTAYQAISLPQAYTGMGVMVGVMDIGFDLTHPNFYDSSATRYRIRSLWDQLSADTIGSPHYVGNSYHGPDALLNYRHTRDGNDQTHGTHTLGSIAGSGYDTRYRGIAFDSDICLVANATAEDAALIDSTDYYKYTYATDVLGFKYIFDTADSLGMPCVISFSEGAPQDFRGDDLLYYAMLDSLTGPGHIIVSSAGNEGMTPSFVHKPAGIESRGTFIYTLSNSASVTVNSCGAATIRTIVYGTENNDTISIPVKTIADYTDSTLADSIITANGKLYIVANTYTNCYSPDRTVCDLQLSTSGRLSSLGAISIELVGKEADAEMYRNDGYFVSSKRNPAIDDAECTHNINSPAASPSVICVGANSYRPSFENYLGDKRVYDMGTNGQRAGYSSVGPTYDGRIKPDVVAPGTNIISSYSSFYLENHPNASDILSDVAHFDFNGRKYAWNANSGTSMASPVAAGVIALWLQANPKLTPQDVLGVIRRTSTHHDPTLSYPNNQYGYGEINAYAGLLDILGISGISDISHNMASGTDIRPLPNGIIRLSFTEKPSQPITVKVYSLSGKMVQQQTLMPYDKEAYMTLDANISGVVAIQISGQKQYSGSQLIRINK